MESNLCKNGCLKEQNKILQIQRGHIIFASGMEMVTINIRVDLHWEAGIARVTDRKISIYGSAVIEVRLM